ncbi:PD40 domain-containing protein [Patescibacteria group bacterium]|nr:PD40 domain-containing protein [Patescibacteria group bacterium]
MEPNSSGNTEKQNNLGEAGQDSHSSKRSLVAISILAIIFAGVAVFWFFSQEEKIESFVDLKGKVYLTLALANDNAADLYVLDIESRNISKFLDDGFVKYTSEISPNGDKIAYTAAPIDRESKFAFPHTEFLQVYVKNFGNGIVGKLTDSRTNAKRLPTWSPDGTQIAFTAQYPDASEDDFSIPNEWGVGVVDLSGNIERIDSGTSPFWSPDGNKLLFLKNDGLYTYNFNDKESIKVWSVVGGEASTNMKFDVSKDGLLLALSVANNRGLELYEIISWEPFQLTLKQKIDIGNNMAFWPVFSPDNRYLIFQEVSVSEENGKLINPVLIIYDIKTSERMKFVSIDEYNFDMAFITDWR